MVVGYNGVTSRRKWATRLSGPLAYQIRYHASTITTLKDRPPVGRFARFIFFSVIVVVVIIVKPPSQSCNIPRDRETQTAQLAVEGLATWCNVEI